MDERFPEGDDPRSYSMPELERMTDISNIGLDLLTDEEASAIGAEDRQPRMSGDFGENLAEYCDEGFLGQLAYRVIEWADEDRESREPWQKREAKSVRMLGVTEETEGGADFDGASRVVHPIMGIGCIQFQARSIAELWPAEGPAKTAVLGDSNQDVQHQATRVGDFINYQYTQLMPGAFEELDRLLMRLPISGSCFKRVYYDPLEETVCSRFVEPSKVLVPYAATDMASVPHFEYEFEETDRDTRALMLSGHYLEVELSPPGDSAEDRTTVQEAVDDADGSTPVSTHDEDELYTRYEAACFLDVPSFEEDLPLPYLVTVDKDSQKVLRIQRNWRPTDERKKRRVHLIHYYFLPGLGFYGYGFAHWMAGLSTAMTGAVRAILDSAFLDNMQGGFVTRDARLGKGKKKIEMGQWNEVDVDAETIKKAFVPFTTKDPSRELVRMLEYLEQVGRLLNSTTENVVGDAANTGPVGTTLALLDQQLKVFSSVHKRLHQAQGRELKLVAELDAETMPEEYPYSVKAGDRSVFAADFDGRVDVIPVSDPNIVTATQRIAQGQSVRQLAAESPDLYNRRAVEERLLEALRVANADELLVAEDQAIPRRDPVTENAVVMQGEPVQVYPDQDHIAHAAVHQAGLGALEGEILERAKPAMQAHLAEHFATIYKLQVARQLGVDLPHPGEDVDPDLELALSRAAARMHQGALRQAEPQSPEPDPVAAAKADAIQAEIERKDALAAVEIGKKEAQINADSERVFAREEGLVQKAIDRGEYGAPEGPELQSHRGLESTE